MKKLKIAIVGMGVAGSYLINQLTRLGHEVVGYQHVSGQNCECICAWGTSRYGINPFTEKCNLNFQDYVIHDGLKFTMSYRGNKVISDANGLVTFR